MRTYAIPETRLLPTCFGESQVQFGHAGACARGQGETAADKNAALAAAGAVVPVSFDEFPSKIKEVFDG